MIAILLLHVIASSSGHFAPCGASPSAYRTFFSSNAFVDVSLLAIENAGLDCDNIFDGQLSARKLNQELNVVNSDDQQAIITAVQKLEARLRASPNSMREWRAVNLHLADSWVLPLLLNGSTLYLIWLRYYDSFNHPHGSSKADSSVPAHLVNLEIDTCHLGTFLSTIIICPTCPGAQILLQQLQEQGYFDADSYLYHNLKLMFTWQFFLGMTICSFFAGTPVNLMGLRGMDEISLLGGALFGYHFLWWVLPKAFIRFASWCRLLLTLFDIIKFTIGMILLAVTALLNVLSVIVRFTMWCLRNPMFWVIVAVLGFYIRG
jgi:hypothetical protein